MSKCWVYHETEAPKIVDAKEAEGLYKEGWADSPAQWLVLSDVMDMKNPTEVQLVGEVMQETADRANDALAAETARSKGLNILAKKYGVEVGEMKIKDLRIAVIEAINGDSA